MRLLGLGAPGPLAARQVSRKESVAPCPGSAKSRCQWVKETYDPSCRVLMGLCLSRTLETPTVRDLGSCATALGFRAYACYGPQPVQVVVGCFAPGVPPRILLLCVARGRGDLLCWSFTGESSWPLSSSAVGRRHWVFVFLPTALPCPWRNFVCWTTGEQCAAVFGCTLQAYSVIAACLLSPRAYVCPTLPPFGLNFFP